MTMLDVARRSGVSVATVSNVLHTTAPVADGDPAAGARRRSTSSATARTRWPARSSAASTQHARGRHARRPEPVPRRDRPAGRAARPPRRVRRAHRRDRRTTRDTEADQVRALVGRRVDGVIFPAVTAGSAIPGELLDRGIPVVVVSFEGARPAPGHRSPSTSPPRWGGGRAPGRRSATGGSPSRTRPRCTRRRSTAGPRRCGRRSPATACDPCRHARRRRPPSAAPTT